MLSTTSIKRAVAALAATTLLATPIAAAAAPASSPAAKLSLRQARSAAPVRGVNRANAETSTFINIGILAALVVGVLVLTGGDDDNDSPDSP